MAMLISTDGAAADTPNRVRRWLRADLADLVDVAGPRDGVAPAAAGSGAGPASFDGDLRLLRRRIGRRWALAAAGRYALAALAVAVVPAALAAFGPIGWIWAIVVPVALFVVALGLRLLRPPSLAQVARLLDDRLGLFDVTATALQVERSGEPVDEGPAAPVFAEAAALVRAGAGVWRPRSRLGGRELAAMGGLVVVLAVIVVVGTGSGGSGSTKVTASAAPGQAHRKGSGLTNVSPPLAPPKAKRPGSKRGASPNNEPRSPLGLYDPGFEGKRPLPRIESGRHSGLYTHGAAKSGGQPQAFAAQSPGEANEAREKAEEEANGAAKATSTGEREGGGGAPESLKSLTGGKAPPSGSVSPLPNANSGARPPSSGSSAAATAPSTSGAAGQRAAAGATGAQGGGSPAGGATAGHQRASLGGGEEGPEGGRTGSGALGLRAGFAAARGGKAATARGPHNAQGGGGPGRSAGIAGSAFEESTAGSLGYVPPDAGIAPGLDPGLFARYLNALGRIEGRRW
jgi:hypothetical protein